MFLALSAFTKLFFRFLQDDPSRDCLWMKMKLKNYLFVGIRSALQPSELRRLTYGFRNNNQYGTSIAFQLNSLRNIFPITEVDTIKVNRRFEKFSWKGKSRTFRKCLPLLSFIFISLAATPKIASGFNLRWWTQKSTIAFMCNIRCVQLAAHIQSPANYAIKVQLISVYLINWTRSVREGSASWWNIIKTDTSELKATNINSMINIWCISMHDGAVNWLCCRNRKLFDKWVVSSPSQMENSFMSQLLMCLCCSMSHKP